MMATTWSGWVMAARTPSSCRRSATASVSWSR
jgi:hypothetical protein